MHIPKFFRIIAPPAQAGMRRTGIRASLVMALAYKISKYGRNETAAKHFSLFRLPADSSWTGPTGIWKATEWYMGRYTTKFIRIRAYENFEASVEDYYEYLMEAKTPSGEYRFRNLQDTPDIDACLRLFMQDNPDLPDSYLTSLKKIISENNLEAYDAV